MDPVVCLLPSPLLGPACWRPVAAELTGRGWPVAGVPVPRAAPRSGADALAAFLAAIPVDRDVVLVPHSNAGLFVPALATQGRVAGYVFVDAGLPGLADGGLAGSAGAAGAGAADALARVPMIPREFYDMLAGKADGDGMLPPWTLWWDDEDLRGLFPDARTREAVEREEHRLPLSYFAESVSIPPGWPDRPGAYLAFGDTYAEERSAAAARDWPVATLPGEHLHMLVDPAQVAAAIAELIAAMAVT